MGFLTLLNRWANESGLLGLANTVAIILIAVLIVLPKAGIDTTPITSDAPKYVVPMTPGQVSALEICQRAKENNGISAFKIDGGIRYLAQYGIQTLEWVWNPDVDNSIGAVDGVTQVLGDEVKECLLKAKSPS